MVSTFIWDQRPTSQTLCQRGVCTVFNLAPIRCSIKAMMTISRPCVSPSGLWAVYKQESCLCCLCPLNSAQDTIGGSKHLWSKAELCLTLHLEIEGFQLGDFLQLLTFCVSMETDIVTMLVSIFFTEKICCTATIVMMFILCGFELHMLRACKIEPSPLPQVGWHRIVFRPVDLLPQQQYDP